MKLRVNKYLLFFLLSFFAVFITNAQSAFITTWTTTTNNESITIPTHPDETYNYSVSWGDGSGVFLGNTGSVTHTYANPGTYTIVIDGTFPQIYFNNNGDASKIQSIESWGANIQWTSMENAFYGCSNLVINATNIPDLSNATSTSRMFQNATALIDNGGEIENWDMSTITNVSHMFRDAISFNAPIGNWNTSNMEIFSRALQGTLAFDQNLGNWDISSATSMQALLANAGISTTNYDHTLIGWSNLTDNETQIPSAITFNGGNSTFCLSRNERDNLINNYSWVISDGAEVANCDLDDYFITTWETTTDNESITIPTFGSGYNYIIDWGDGTLESGLTGDATHTYTNSGTFTIKISGDFPAIYFNNTGDKDKIKSIEQWGAIAWGSFENAFWGCTDLVNVAIDTPNLLGVTSMNNIFRVCNEIGFNGEGNWLWDTQFVTQMNGAFYNSDKFNGDISLWNVSNVEQMHGMFAFSNVFNIDISNWNVGKVWRMSDLFWGATNFNQNLNSWDVSEVTTMKNSFRNATSFNQNLADWDISKVTSMEDMFTNITLSLTNYDATLIGWNTLGTGETAIPQDIVFSGGNSIYCNAYFNRLDLMDNYNWTITDGEADVLCNPTNAFVTTWETTTNNESIGFPTINSVYDITVDWGDGTIQSYANTDLVPEVNHSYAVPGVYTVRVEGILNKLFYHLNPLRLKIRSIEQWGNIRWNQLENTFRGCEFLELNATDIPDLSNVDNIEGLFASCFQIGQNNATNWNWNTSGVGSMSELFLSATNFNQDISGWDVSNVMRMESMFKDAQSFNQNISTWDTSNATNMDNMFDGATAFDQNLGSWDISSIVDMSGMFQNTQLSTINYDATLIGWHTDSSGIANDDVDDVPSNITFSGGNSQYCASETQRTDLLSTYNWTITTDGGSGCNASDYFITTWTVAENETITIPTTGNNYSYDVDWSYDGTTFNAESMGVTGDATSPVLTAGTYTVALRGAFSRIYFNNLGDKDKIQTIEQWGTTQWSSMENAFYGCTNLNITNILIDVPNLNLVTNMKSMFRDASNFNGVINNWDVSSVENMSFMFFNAITFNQALNNWNTSNLTDINHMFFNADVFNQSLNSWDVSSVTRMGNLFTFAIAFNQPLNDWNVSSVEDMSSMFLGATSFDQPLNNWNVQNVTGMYVVFSGALSFNQSLADWDLSNVSGMDNMLNNTTLSTANYDATLIGWHTDTSGVANDGIDDIPSNINFHGGNSLYCTGENARNSLDTTYNWDITDGGLGCTASDYFITTWTVAENETITIPTFTGENYTYDVDWSYDGSVFNSESTAVTGDATSPVLTAGTYTVAIRGVFPRIYFNSTGDKDKIQTVQQWGTGEWSSMDRAFIRCTKLRIAAIDAPDLSSVTSLKEMFANCFELQSPDLSNWDVSTIESMDNMFINTTQFNGNITNWNVGKVVDFNRMFANAKKFNQDISQWNIGESTTGNIRMDQMFYLARDFNQNIGIWDISNVTNMTGMFFGATLSTTNYDATIIGWHTDASGVENDGIDDVPFNITFSGGSSTYCISETQRNDLISTQNWIITDGGLGCTTTDYFITTWTVAENETITIPTTGNNYSYDVDWSYDGTTFNAESMGVTGDATSPVLTAGTYTVALRGAFSRIYFNNLGDKDKIQTIEQWGTTQWSSMENAFYGCTNLNITNILIDVPNLNLVTNMKSMFRDASNFNGVINNWDVSSVENMSFMFFNAITFNQALNNWNTSNLTDINHMFFNADVFNQSLNSWDVSNVTRIGNLFTFAIAYNQPLNNWNVSSVEDMSSMFLGATSFNQPLNNWNVQGVTGMYTIFSGALSFNQSLANWDLSNVLGLDGMLESTALSTANYDATLIGWHTDTSGVANDGIDDIPSNINFHGGNGMYCISETQRNDLISTYNWTITDGGLNCTISLSPKVYLQGASLNPNTGEETLMRDDLRVAGYIPTTSPYADVLTCNATVFNTTGNDAIVDWVWIELRDETDNTVVIDSQSALLQRDGDVVDVDGMSALSFTASADSYYVAIKHRNHLGVMSNATIALGIIETVLDFTDSANQITFGTDAQTTFGTPSGVVAMWAGDTNGDGRLNYSGAFSDIPSIRSQVFNDPNNSVFGGPPVASYPSQGYNETDVNMDGVTVYSGSASDVLQIRNNIFNNPSNSVFGGPPTSTYVFVQQLPEGVN